MTHTEIIYRRRIAVLAHAQRTKNVAETCRTFGISRTRYYEWKNRADLYGLEALMPKERRSPQMPSATPTHVVERLLTLAVLEPTIGCRQYADRLGDQGFVIAKSTVQKHLVDHGLGPGPAPGPSRGHHGGHDGTCDRGGPRDEPFGFCLASGGPGELVCVDSFYIGRLKGVGKVYQLSAIDVFTRWAFVWLVLGTPDATVSMRFFDRCCATTAATASRSAPCSPTTAPSTTPRPSAALGGQGAHPRAHPAPLAQPQRRGRALPRDHPPRVLAPRLPPPALHLGRQLQAEADAYLLTYNRRRRNHGDYMRGRTPQEILDNHKQLRQHDHHQPQRPSVTSPAVPHLASILARRAVTLVSRACTFVMRLAMNVASLVWPAAFAFASRAWALGRRALTLDSHVWIRASTLAALAHTAGDNEPEPGVVVAAAPAVPARPRLNARRRAPSLR